MSKATVLLADDDKAICTVLEQAIRRQGYAIEVTHSGQQLMAWVKEGKGDVVITDVLMPGSNGLDMLPAMKALRPDLPVIVISAQNTLMTAVKANQLGAYEYLPKPFDLDVLMQHIAQSMRVGAAQPAQPAETMEQMQERLATPIIGRSAAMQEIYRTLARVVPIDLTVMITGESGTGKELIARALHALGPRKHKPLIALNMAAIPKELVESELFGHEKGAFTGAQARKAGAFEQAEGGTLFLDEIGDMPTLAQTRLLRVLQQGEYTTVGGTRILRANVRIITATHRDLSQLVANGTFREDLYYRLNVVPLRSPSLRERMDDIPELVAHFMGKAQAKGLARKEITPDGMKALGAHTWPGNVRELENLIYRMASLYSEAVIDARIIQKELVNQTTVQKQDEKPFTEVIRKYVQAYFKSHGNTLPPAGVYDRLMPLVEKPLIEITLDATEGNQLKAAQLLGMNRNTLRKKIGELGIVVSRKPSGSSTEE
jgi:two-component system nitrogen regulation response regulator GlnG